VINRKINNNQALRHIVLNGLVVLQQMLQSLGKSVEIMKHHCSQMEESIKLLSKDKKED